MGATAPGKSGEKWHGVAAEGGGGRPRPPDSSNGKNFMAAPIERSHLLS